jgi:hypothetical protein
MAARKRIFVSFAMEDRTYRDLLRGQARLGGSPIEYADFSVRRAWDSSWKTQCRARIKGCDGVIALLSNQVRQADGARWEIRCAVEEGVPIVGVHVGADRYVPPELAGKRVLTWTWDGIANWIQRL